MKKDIGDMLHISYEDISKVNTSEKSLRIDAIINAAKPTLMGSNQGVDGDVHNAIDKLLSKAYNGSDRSPTFNDKIKEELGVKGSKNQILCPRGSAIITGGYGLCDYVIHVVGSEYDIRTDKAKCPTVITKYLKNHEICSSSRIRTLETCYYEIVRILRRYPDIKNIAIPIISSGEYGFPFEMAVKIAVASIGNALLEWQREDEESFNSSSEWIQNIYFFVWNRSQEECNKAQDILKKYKEIFSDGQQVVWQKSWCAQQQYFVEIIKYDKNRGYFCIARMIRIVLSVLRFFSVYTYLKDLGGGHRWERRRLWVELTVVLKIFLAAAAVVVLIQCDACRTGPVNTAVMAVLCYDLADTVTYLISLLIMADIQKPSANVIRSMLLLAFNYIEVSLEMTCLFFEQFKERTMTVLQALEPGVLGNMPSGMEKKVEFLSDYMLFYGNIALKFFFVTLVFGYMAGHMRQRQFRS